MTPVPTSTNTNKVRHNASSQVSWNIDTIALSVDGSVLKQNVYFHTAAFIALLETTAVGKGFPGKLLYQRVSGQLLLLWTV